MAWVLWSKNMYEKKLLYTIYSSVCEEYSVIVNGLL